MTHNRNRRTFLVLTGASAAAVAIGRPITYDSPSSTAQPPGTPRCFMDGKKSQLAARPKTTAIQHLPE